MAKGRIKGITVEIGGDTTGLDKALKSVNSTISKTQGALNDVTRLLKLDPSNTTLVAQKQKLLAQAVKQTKEKLSQLESVQEQVKDSVKNYDAWKAAYDPIQKEISETQKKLEKLREEQQKMEDIGEIDTMEYAAIQEEIEETTNCLKDLKAKAKEVSDEFGNPISPEAYDAFEREIEATRGTLNKYQSDLSDLETEQARLSTNTERLNKLFSATGTSIDDYADVLGGRLTSAIRNGAANSDQLMAAIEKVGKSATGGKADIKQLTAALDTVDDGQAIKNLIKDLDDAGDSAEHFKDMIEGSVAMQAADQLSVVGDKIEELGSKAVDAFSDAENATIKVNAYFGETGAAAEQSSKVIQNVYGAGVGESMDSVADAVLMVKRNLGELDDTRLTNITQQAITLEELYGIDMNETLRGARQLMEQYGITAQQAMDYIVTGTQNGLDKTEELGDNLSEYSGKFAQAGYSAQEYFQLLQNGLDGGAYNLDKVNDAINEITTRLADGTIGDSIGSYSDKTQELFTAWQDGGATQKEVIDSIVADIAGCTNQQEAMNLAAQAFGTMAEDGNLKFISSLTSVGDTYDDVSGAAQNMFDQTTTPMQEMESNIRKVQQSLQPLGEKLMELANVILPALSRIISAVSNWFGSLPDPVQNFAVILGVLLAAFTALTPIIAAIVLSVKTFGSILVPVVGIIAGVAAAIAAIIAIIQNWGTITEIAGNIFHSVVDAIGQKIEALKGFFSGMVDQVSSAWDMFKSKTIEVFQSVCDWIGQKIEAIKNFFIGLWTSLQNIWDMICNVVQVAVMMLGSIISAAFQIITLPFQFIWQNCKDTVLSVWESIKTIVLNAINNVATVLSTVMNTIWNVIITYWNSISTTISAVLSVIQSIITTIFNAISTQVSVVWNTIKMIVTTVIVAIQNKISAVFNAVKNTVSTVFNTVKNTASSVWNGIKSVISSVVDGIKTKVSSGFNSVKSTLSSVFNSIKSVATNAWNGVKNAIIKPIEQAKDKVKAMVDQIKGFFSNLKLSLPHIKLPHFKITGTLSLNPPSVPHLSIDWYKEGGILTKPTVFGMNGSSLMAGGEAGAEAVLPLSGFYKNLDAMLSNRLDTSKMEQYLAVIADNSSKGIYLSDGTLIGKLLPGIDEGLADLANLRTRYV